MRKVFDYRFRGEDTKVVSCNTFHKNANLQKIWRRLRHYRSKIAEYEEDSRASGEVQYIWVGQKSKCNRRLVEACKFYEIKLEQVQKDWEKTKKSFESENQGIVILVLKTKACVEQVYEELVKMLGS